MTRLEEVSVTVTRSDGERTYTIQGSMSLDDGWSQWGETRETLCDNVDLMNALHEAFCGKVVVDDRD